MLGEGIHQHVSLSHFAVHLNSIAHVSLPLGDGVLGRGTGAVGDIELLHAAAAGGVVLRDTQWSRLGRLVGLTFDGGLLWLEHRGLVPVG